MDIAYKTRVNEEKRDAVEALKARFSEGKDFVFADYRGLTVEQITELRGKLRGQDAEFKVIKNNFAKIAFREMDKPEALGDYFTGPTAVAIAKGESGPVVKSLIDYAKEWPIQVKGGLIAGSVYGPKEIEAYSRLPGREQLLAMLMGTMNAPLQNLVYAMNGVTTKLVRTLQAVADKKSAA